MKRYPLLFTLLLTFLIIGPITAKAQTTSRAKQKRERKKASRKAAEFANQWQGEEAAAQASSDDLEEAFGEAAAIEKTQNEAEPPAAITAQDSILTFGPNSIYTLEEQKKLKLSALKQARKKLDKKSETFARDLAKIDLQERYWDAEDIREAVTEGKYVFSFQTIRGPKLISYDENGEWLSTISLLNHNQVPVGVRKLAKKFEMDVMQFEDKFRIEMRDLRRPVYAVYTSQRGLLLDTVLQQPDGMLQENLVAGVEVYGHGNHFTHGRFLQTMNPDDIGFLAVVITADGLEVPERDIVRLLEGQLFLYPQHFQNAQSSWTPPLGWEKGKDWFVKPDWEPEYNRWYPTQDWYVDTDW
ncbi:MAG: hypothetical protein AAF927_01195 [Bacteroidota bacterium]